MTLTNATPKILTMLDDDGELPAFAWPGGYPLFYLDSENNVLCPKCANDNDEYSAQLIDCDANWEDPLLYCDHCSERIPSAYAEDDAPDAPR